MPASAPLGLTTLFEGYFEEIAMGISLDVFLRRLSDTGHTSHRLYSLEPQCEPAEVLGERSASVRASFLCGAHRALLLHFVHTHCMNDEASLSKLITDAVEEACRHGLDSIRQTEGQ